MRGEVPLGLVRLSAGLMGEGRGAALGSSCELECERAPAKTSNTGAPASISSKLTRDSSTEGDSVPTRTSPGAGTKCASASAPPKARGSGRPALSGD